jgi:hypothetical protein
MMSMKRRIGLLSILCILPVAHADAGDAAGALRDRGEEFCFGRSYDGAHLARNRRQKLLALFVYRDFSGDPLSEDKPLTRDQAKTRERNAARPTFNIIRQYRGGRIQRSESACESDGDAIDCSPDSEELADYALVLRAAGDKLNAKNGQEQKTGYPLERMPMSVCRSWRDRARPGWVGKGQPLRVRFAERAPVCYRLDQDISKRPRQNVVSIALRFNRPVEIDDNEKVAFTMLRVTASVKLKDGTVRSRDARCDSADYYFWCQYGYGAIRLAAIEDRAIHVFSGPKSSPSERPEIEKFFDLPLGADDRAFRLTERDDETCELQ